MIKKHYRILWIRELPNFEIIGHSIYCISIPSYDPICLYYKGTLIKT